MSATTARVVISPEEILNTGTGQWQELAEARNVKMMNYISTFNLFLVSASIYMLAETSWFVWQKFSNPGSD